MSASSLPALRARVAPLVLVCEDDAGTREILQLALTQQGYRVVLAADGDEAIRRVAVERPDLVLCDLRVPGRSGLEVCDHLRHDAADPHVPIILVSASADTEARCEGLARGADDYIVKPFSPRELVARVARLLARTSEARRVREQQQDLERDLARAREDSRRARADLTREQRLRATALRASRTLHHVLDPDDLEARLLHDARTLLTSDWALLLAPAADGALCAQRVLGTVPVRTDTLVLRDGDALGRWLASLGRPVSRAELERVHEAREALGPFIAAGAGWFVPLTGANGLEGVIVAGEALDPGVHTLQSREALETWGECAASACVHARRHREARRRTVEWLAERVAEHPGLREALRDALGQQGDHAA